MSRRQTPSANIALFSRSADSSAPWNSLGEEVLSSGPYSDSIYGVSTARKRIGAGTYILVPSTHSPGLVGDFEITIWSERRVELGS
jgi:calpain-7